MQLQEELVAAEHSVRSGKPQSCACASQNRHHLVHCACMQGHASQMSRDERPETDPIDFNLLAAMDSRGLGSQPFPAPCAQNTQVGLPVDTIILSSVTLHLCSQQPCACSVLHDGAPGTVCLADLAIQRSMRRQPKPALGHVSACTHQGWVVSQTVKGSSLVQGNSQNRGGAVPRPVVEAGDVLSPQGRQGIDARLPPQRRQAPAQRTPPANVRRCPLPQFVQLPLAWTRHFDMGFMQSAVYLG